MATANPLGEYPKFRKTLYKVYWAVGLVLGAIPVATAAIPDASVPMWSVSAMAVYGYLGIAFGFTADKNTDPDDLDVDPEDGDLEVDPDEEL